MSNWRIFVLALAVMIVFGGCHGCNCFDLGDGSNDGCAPIELCVFACNDGGLTSSGSFGDGGPCICPDGLDCDPYGKCCDAAERCGGLCCGPGAVCWFLQCSAPGAACSSSSECKAGEVCDFGAAPPDPGAQGGGGAGGTCGTSVPTGQCLPAPAVCEGGEPDGACLPACLLPPQPSVAAPAAVASWGDAAAVDGQDSVVTTPIVVQLDDDDCNGVVDGRDQPDIVFLTAAENDAPGQGALHAVSRKDGALVEKWTAVAAAVAPNDPASGIAAGRTKSGLAIVLCTTDHRVRAYGADGAELWVGAPSAACALPEIADLDKNGDPEVITESQVLDLASGAEIVKAFASPVVGSVIVADADKAPDHLVEIVSAGRAYRGDGTVLADTGKDGSFVAVADLDGDAAPEIVAVQSEAGQHHLMVWRVDGLAPGGATIVRGDVDLHAGLPDPCAPGSPGADHAGGPPVLADLNGDGLPDVGVSGSRGYVAFDGKKLMDPSVTDAEALLWAVAAPDCAGGRRGSTAFDLDGDGRAEVVAADDQHVSIRSGLDGSLLSEICNTSESTTAYPLVADADGDGLADLVAPSSSRGTVTCDGGENAGVRLLAPASGWTRARRQWNEHGYHVTNIEDDGAVPESEAMYWLVPALDAFRANVADLSAPNLVVTLAQDCSRGLVARVENRGAPTVPAGDVRVTFHEGSATGPTLGSAIVGVPLASGAAVLVSIPIASPLDGTFAAVVEPAKAVSWIECTTGDDVSVAEVHCRS